MMTPTAKDVLNLVKQLPAKELYKLADFMDFGDDGMWSQDVHEAIESAEYDWSDDGETQTPLLHLGMSLGHVAVKITYQNTAADGDSPDYGEYKAEIVENNK